MIVKPESRYEPLHSALQEAGLYSSPESLEGNHWRISPEPYYLSREQVAFFQKLGPILVDFYKALNQLYFDSVKGKVPAWVAEYLDLGKPRDLIDYSRMKRFKSLLPGIIRPDVLETDQGFVVTELDSVPGGFGLTELLMDLYQQPGQQLVGEEAGGIIQNLYRMFESACGTKNCAVAIVVSEEASDYLSEMTYLVNAMKSKGLAVYLARPEQIVFREEGLFLPVEGKEISIQLIYRFFELFDLKNIPKTELFMYSNKKGKVKTTPPYKPFLEEKLTFALFQHPVLAGFWEKTLSAESFATLSHLIPNTWVMDSRPLPPQSVIPGLTIRDQMVNDWKALDNLTQKERELVVKISGFSPKAWGSRGVTMGHDVSSEVWRQTVESSLADFENEPSILQEFHKARRCKVSYYHPSTQDLVEMESRARLTPYYFVVDGEARLGGILAALCPHNKKKIHGMQDAVMVPCAVRNETNG